MGCTGDQFRLVGNGAARRALLRRSPRSLHLGADSEAVSERGHRRQNGQLRLHAGNSMGARCDASADALVIGVEGAQTRYDFEPETPCKETCYVDGALGNDAFGGDTPASAKRTIQAALAQVAPGGEIIVAAGTYSEALTLTNR
jgi:hypothetical protein